MLRAGLVGVADHGEHAALLRHAVDGEGGVEDLVAAVLAVGLGEHHQLDVGRVAGQAGEGGHQVVDLILGQRQAELRVGLFQRATAAAQHVDAGHRRGLQLGEQLAGLAAVQHGALGHAVVQQGCQGLQAVRVQGLGLAQQTAFERDAVFGDALHPPDRQAAVVGDVGGLGGPGRDGAETRRHHDGRAGGAAGSRLTILQQCRQPLHFRAGRGVVGYHQVDKTGGKAADPVVDGLQPGEQLLDAERAEGVAALELGDVQGHW